MEWLQYGLKLYVNHKVAGIWAKAVSQPYPWCGLNLFTAHTLLLIQAGKWRIKKGIYKDIALKTKELLKNITNTSLYWIPRAINKEADALANLGVSGM